MSQPLGRGLSIRSLTVKQQLTSATTTGNLSQTAIDTAATTTYSLMHIDMRRISREGENIAQKTELQVKIQDKIEELCKSNNPIQHDKKQLVDWMKNIAKVGVEISEIFNDCLELYYKSTDEEYKQKLTQIVQYLFCKIPLTHQQAILIIDCICTIDQITLPYQQAATWITFIKIKSNNDTTVNIYEFIMHRCYGMNTLTSKAQSTTQECYRKLRLEAIHTRLQELYNDDMPETRSMPEARSIIDRMNIVYLLNTLHDPDKKVKIISMIFSQSKLNAITILLNHNLDQNRTWSDSYLWSIIRLNDLYLAGGYDIILLRTIDSYDSIIKQQLPQYILDHLMSKLTAEAIANSYFKQITDAELFKNPHKANANNV